MTRLAKFYSKIWKKVRDKIHVDPNSHIKWFPKLVEVHQRYQQDSPGHFTSVCCFGSDVAVPIFQDWSCFVEGSVEGTWVIKDDKFSTSLNHNLTVPISRWISAIDEQKEWSLRLLNKNNYWCGIIQSQNMILDLGLPWLALTMKAMGEIVNGSPTIRKRMVISQITILTQPNQRTRVVLE